MAAAASRTKTLHYKRAVLVGATNATQTLRTYLDAALAAKQRPMQRQERLGESSDNVRMINKCRIVNKMVCGRFLDFTEGGSQAVLELDADADELKIKHLAPGKAEQYLEGILTFGVRDNHVVLVPSKGLRVAHLEKHLNWLLGEHTRVMPPEVHIALEDAPKSEVREKLADVDWIELRTVVPTSIFRPTNVPVAPKSFIGGVLSQMKQYTPSVSNFFEQLSGDAALAVDDVELKMLIKRKGRRSSKRHSMLDDIAHNLRNADDVDFTLKTKDATYTDGELKLRVDRSLPVEPGTTHMPELKGAAAVMQEWLADLLTQRRIEEQ